VLRARYALSGDAALPPAFKVGLHACRRLSAKPLASNHDHVTAAAITGAAFVMLRSMPPHLIVMATGPEGDAYYEVGR
jgi:hypothetical protein